MKNFQLSILNFQLLTLLLAGVFALAGCSKEKEEDPFTGTDNYITAFVLQQGDTVLNATIANRVITITVPEGFLLTDAKATVTLSENAKIIPDPAGIINWEVEQRFAVTAHDGTRAEYEYTLKRSPIAHEGTVLLYTQADVDAFGAQGISHINGNLIIGRTAGTDSITSLAPLESLKEVAYNLTFNSTCAITNLEGLESLERIGGMLKASALKHIETLQLPALETVDGIELINRTAWVVVDLPKLTRVPQWMNLDCQLSEVNLPSLQSAGSLTIMIGVNDNTAALEEINLPELTEVGMMDINRFLELTRISLPKLKKAGTIYWRYSTKLATIYTPLLEEVESITWNANALRELDFPKLSKVTSLLAPSTDLMGLESASFPLVTSVRELSFSQGAASAAIKGFTALRTAASVTLGFSDDDKNNIVFPPSVESIGRLKISGQNNARESGTVDFHGIAIDVIDYDRYCEGITLIGDDVFHGTLRLYQPTSYAMALPVLQGFSEVDSIYIGLPSRAGAEGLIPGFRKVNRGVLITGASSAISFNLPDMEEIGGIANITVQFQGTSATATAVSFPKLKSVGGNFTLAVVAKTVETLTCPELTTVGGNFILYTDYDMANGTRKGLKTALFPKLATIGGKLTVRPSTLNSASYANAQLTDLNGFASLRSVQAVEIAWMTNLTDYSGLQGAFTAAPWGAGNWTVTGNDYNPTYQDLVDGKWIK